MAIDLARLAPNATSNVGVIDRSLIGERQRKAIADAAKAAQDLQKGQIDLAKEALVQKELERNTLEAEQGRGVRRDFIINREGALDLPVGVRSPEFSQEQRPSNAPFGPMGAPAPRNPVEARTTIDLARINPDMADSFRTGQISERQGLEDRGRKQGAEDKAQIYAANTDTSAADDQKIQNRQLSNAEKQQIIANNLAWFQANTGRKNAENTATAKAGGKPLPSNRVIELADQQSALKQMDTMYPEALAFAKKAGSAGPLYNRLSAMNPWNSEAQGIKQYIAATKQIIGKSLEGGVLRKEDEAKYEKIIPNIGDTPETLELKNNQLRALISNRRTEQMKELKQAGYNVGDFEESVAAPENFNPDDWEAVQ